MVKKQIKSQNEYINKFIEEFYEKQSRQPTIEEIEIVKNQYRRFYIKEYQEEYKHVKKFLKITFTRDESNDFSRYAKKFGKKKSVLAKEILLNSVYGKNTITTETDEKLQNTIIQMRKIGTNINQMAKLANQNDMGVYEETFNRALQSLGQLEEKVFDFVKKKDK